MLNWENKIQSALIYLSLILGLSSAIAGLVEFIGTNKFTPIIIIYFSCFLVFMIPKIIQIYISLKFRAIKEEDFINQLDFKKIDKIWILSHTGRVIFDAINKKLDKLKETEIPKEIHVLTRTRLIESMDRNE